MSEKAGHGLSRRAFLGSAAAVLATSGLRGIPGPPRPRVAVIGAGAFGGWTALHLARLGASVTLIDAWGPGNPRSSSGGETRVIRAIYGADRIYVEMVRRAFEMWEQLDGRSAGSLYVPTGALWLHRGDDAYVRSSVPVLEDAGFAVEQLTIAEGVRRYPQIDFRGVESLWLERRAGVLSARRACLAVRDEFERAGGSYRTAQVAPPALEKAASSLKLSDGSRIEADVYLFACGPWLGTMFPNAIGDRVRPTRQEVYYFGTPPGSQRYRAESFPVWIDFGERIFYGIPDVHGQGFKLADDTRGELFDPTNGDRNAREEGIRRARAILKERFPELATAPLLKAEVCQYENSPDGHLIIARHPQAENVWLIGGGSGHGFKLGPAVGELVADAVLSGAAIPETFSLERLRNVTKPSTQFETKPKS